MGLKQSLSSSTLWMSFSASGISIVSFILFIILSRILAVEDIGLMAFALIIVEAGKILLNAGCTQAIIRHDSWDQKFASNCFYLNLAGATLVTLAVTLIGVPLIEKYYAPESGLLFISLCAIFYLEAMKVVHDGKLRRDFLFSIIAVRTVCGSLISGGLGIYLAFNGYGVWALVWQQLSNQLIVTVITLISVKWWPSFSFSITRTLDIARFSLPLMFSQLVNTLSISILELFIGIVLGPAALGIYRVGGRALFILQDVVLKPFEHTSLSALSRMTSVALQAQGTIRMMRITLFLTLPIFFGASAIAPAFILLAFGEKWAASGEIMAILALGVTPFALMYHINAALTARGKSNLVMMLSLIALVLTCGIGAFVVPFGIEVAAYGFLLRNLLICLVSLFVFHKIFHSNIKQLFFQLIPSITAALIMYSLILLAYKNLPLNLVLPAQLLIICILGGLIYIALMLLVFRTETRNFLTEIRGLVPNKLKPVIERFQLITRLDNR